jgi:hypothetical protein
MKPLSSVIAACALALGTGCTNLHFAQEDVSMQVMAEEYSPLLALRRSGGEPFFRKDEVEAFIRNGGNEILAKRYLQLKRHDGSETFSAFSLNKYLASGGTFEYAASLAVLRTLSGVSIFDGFEIKQFHDLSVPIDFAIDLSIYDNGSPDVLAHQIKEYWKAQGSVEFARKAIALFTVEKMPASVYSVTCLWKSGVTLDSLESLLEVRDHEGLPIAPTVILDAVQNPRVRPALLALGKLRGTQNNALFDKPMIQQYLADPVFLEHIVSWCEECGNEYPENFFVARAFQLGYRPDLLDTFVDTTRPNAVIDYTTDDERNAFGGRDEVDLFFKIKKVYDVRVIFPHSKKDVYDALDTTPAIALWELAGHGTNHSCTIAKVPEGSALSDSDVRIEINDTELEKHLANLLPDAVIFLNSCSNAATSQSSETGATTQPAMAGTATRPGYQNLAEYMKSVVGKRKVIAVKKAFVPGSLKFISIYPLVPEVEEHVFYK